VVSNTLEAHRLVHYAKNNMPEVVDLLLDLLFDKFQSCGENIANREVLLEISEAVGLKRDSVQIYLDSDEGKEEVLRKDSIAKHSDVVQIPHYTIKGLFSLSSSSFPLSSQPSSCRIVETFEEEEIRSWTVKKLKQKLGFRGVSTCEISPPPFFFDFSSLSINVC